jgi:hypothetical protein
MGDAWLQYSKMLDMLDSIKGKKSVFVYACHSGSFLKALRRHPKRRNYAAITSCEADGLSTNWNDSGLDNDLWEHFRRGGKYSDLELEQLTTTINVGGENRQQRPQMLRYFDVRLI